MQKGCDILAGLFIFLIHKIAQIIISAVRIGTVILIIVDDRIDYLPGL